jgi:diguanylate cyclase (GGDEF)-like protein/PAS domain S-box-containing protein
MAPMHLLPKGAATKADSLIMPGPTATLVLLSGVAAGVALLIWIGGRARRQQERHRQAAIAERRRSEELFRSAFDHSAIGMALVATDGRWLKVNQSLCEITGYTEAELLATTFQAITHPEDLGADLDRVNAVLDGTSRTYQMEKRYLRKDGNIVWVLLSVSLVRDPSGKPLTFVSQIQDISSRKRLEESLRHDSLHDALTGLPNRVLFSDRLAQCLQRAKREPDYRFAVLFLDLDRFKVVNDSLGHAAGDKLLVAVSDRLSGNLRDIDTLAVREDRHVVSRMGGDEFTVILNGVRSPEDAARVAERLIGALRVPYRLDNQEVLPTVSVGIVMGGAGSGYESAEDLLRDADAAMYRAKSLGKDRYELFDRSMHEAAVQRLRLEAELRQALEQGQFRLFYQPIVSLDTAETVGFEALIRWEHPQRGLVAPGAFIAVAEETGQIVAIGQWVLQEACRQLRLWQEQKLISPAVTVSVNLSRRQLDSTSIAGQVREALTAANLDPTCLKLEVTESMMVEGRRAAEALAEIKGLKVELHMDDFGTGYSSMSYLHKLPLDGLKIDRSFVASLSERRDYAAVVHAIVTLARNLGMQVVAEGVETADQVTMLQALGCDKAQGYFFSKPLPAAGVEQFIAAGPRFASAA